MAEYDNIELRSEKVQEIIGKAPGGIVRDGIGMLTTVLVCLALVACFIPYPENVTVSVFVTQVDERYVEVTALVPYRFIRVWIIESGNRRVRRFYCYGIGRQLLLYEAYYRKKGYRAIPLTSKDERHSFNFTFKKKFDRYVFLDFMND